MVVALVAAAGSGAAGPGSLRAQAEILKARQASAAKVEQAALLDLYSLETALGRSRADLAALRAQIASLHREEADARHRLAIARAAVGKSEAALAQELRVLYERGDPNVIAVLLGSESLDAAIEQLDSIDRSARDHKRIIQQTLSARKQANAVATELAARQVALRLVERRRAAAVNRLEQARNSRAAYVRQLRTQRHLAAAKIDALEAQATAAEIKSRRLAAQAAARERARVAAAERAAAAARAAKANGAAGGAGAGSVAATTAPVTAATTTATSGSGSANGPVDVPGAQAGTGTLPADGAAASAGPGERTLTVTMTAYTLRGNTATGLPTSWGIVAVDPNVIPLGTKMTIPGYGDAIAADTGSAVRGATIDVWVPDNAAAKAFGRRTVTIVLH